MSNIIIAGNFPDGLDLDNPLTNPVTITGTIELGTSTQSGALQGETVAAWAITNQGSILGATADGVDLLLGGTVTNAASAVISGLFAVEIQGIAGTVDNSGMLSATSSGAGVYLSAGGDVVNESGGQIQSGDDGVTTTGASAVVTNAGIINAGTSAGAAVDLFAGGSVTNETGASLTGDWGISIQGATGTVVNAGVIAGAAQSGVFLTGGVVTNQSGGTISGNWGIADIDAAGIAVGGTVITSGTIIGTNGTAVTLPAGLTNLLVDNPGAVFSGLADGGNLIGGTVVSTLELGAASLQGTLNGLGTNFVDFGKVLVDPGGAWMLTGSNSLTAGATLTDQGMLLLNAASLAADGAETIGSTAGISASVTVTGGGQWSGGSALVDGDAGGGSILINGQGSMAVATALLGASGGGTGGLEVSGTGSGFSATSTLTVGGSGGGGLTVDNQASATVGGGTEIGGATGSTGSVTVTGAQSTFTGTGQFTIGDSGLASLSVLSGGTVASLGGVVIANAADASGSSVDVTGAGSNWRVTGLLDVGVAGSGALELSGGATVTAGSLDAGNVAAGVGQISVTGTGSELTITNGATVADDGTGVLSVLDGATLMGTSLTIGSQGDSSGALVVSGAGSLIQLSGALNIGTSLGTGDLTVGPGAAVHASVVNLQGQVVLEGGLLDPTVQVINQGQTAGGFGTIAAGDIIDEGVIQAGGTKPSQKLLLVQGTVLGGGTLTVNGTLPGSASSGMLQINAGGTMELSGAVLNAATTTFNDNLTPAGTYTVNNSVVDVTFADAAGVLKLDDISQFGGTVTTFQGGDSFVITGGTLSDLSVSNGDTLTFADSGNGGTDQIIFGSAISASGFDIVNNNTVQVACFAAGTRIETDDGPVAVEQLREGDRVITADGQDEPIVWLGHRTVNCRTHPNPASVWPVLVRAGAFGENAPSRDLYLSPDHAVFVNSVLVPVKLLVNDTSIVQVRRPAVTYFHVELPRHAVILAEGLPVESYLDTGDRSNFHQAGEALRLLPDFEARFAPDSARLWETRAAAPLIVTGPELMAARAFVAANCPPRGFRSNDIKVRAA